MKKKMYTRDEKKKLIIVYLHTKRLVDVSLVPNHLNIHISPLYLSLLYFYYSL